MVGTNRFKRIKTCYTPISIDLYDRFNTKAKSEGWSRAKALRMLIYLYTTDQLDIKEEDCGDM